jgi:hypothetical protein
VNFPITKFIGAPIVQNQINNKISYAINYESSSTERINGEYMMINFDTGCYYSCTGFGADVISLINAKVDRNFWEEILGKAWKIDFDAELNEKLEVFLRSCRTAGLIFQIDISDRSDFNLPNDIQRDKFEFQELHEYQDMKDLLMVDPIHDTTLMGWPDRSES